MTNCWPIVWPLAEPHMDARQHIVLVAVDQRHAVLDRGLQRGAQIVGIDDRGEIAEALGGSAIASYQESSSLFWIWICALGNSAIEPMWSKWACVMTMSVIVSAPTPISASMRTGEIQCRDAELAREPRTVLVLHEAGVDQHVAVAAARQNEGEGQVHHALLDTCR